MTLLVSLVICFGRFLYLFDLISLCDCYYYVSLKLNLMCGDRMSYAKYGNIIPYFYVLQMKIPPKNIAVFNFGQIFVLEQRGKSKELFKPSAGSCAVAFLTLQPCWFTGFCLTK